MAEDISNRELLERMTKEHTEQSKMIASIYNVQLSRMVIDSVKQDNSRFMSSLLAIGLFITSIGFALCATGDWSNLLNTGVGLSIIFLGLTIIFTWSRLPKLFERAIQKAIAETEKGFDRESALEIDEHSNLPLEPKD